MVNFYCLAPVARARSAASKRARSRPRGRALTRGAGCGAAGEGEWGLRILSRVPRLKPRPILMLTGV